MCIRRSRIDFFQVKQNWNPKRCLTPAELIGLVRRLIGEVTRLREENEKLSAALAAQRVENQILKDEIARLKHLPPRPPHKPSGMEKATEGPELSWRLSTGSIFAR